MMMMMSLQVVPLLLLCVSPAVEAFATHSPLLLNHQRCPSSSATTKTRTATSLQVTTGPNGKPASSKEEDLQLTYDIIMNFVGDGSSSVATEEDSQPKEQQQQKKKKKKKKTPQAPPTPEEMDLSKLDIRVGLIEKAWEHPDAEKLFCEEIDIGESDVRQIASGLRAYYTSDDLIGRKVLVLANLKARKLVGFKSHGMVLCASLDDKVVFVDPPVDAEIGSKVVCPEYNQGEPATENQVGKKKILDKVLPDLQTNSDGVVCYKNVPVQCGDDSGLCIAQDQLPNAQVS